MMKKNMKFIGIMTILGVASFTACKKDSTNQMNPDAMSIEIANDEPQVRLANSGYVTEITHELVGGNSNGEGYYTEGIIEYKINNQVVSVVNFGDGSANETAVLTKDGLSSKFNLKKKKENSKYRKVIVKPLVKTNDCNYIVEGTIKYYEIATGAWSATVDYGDGACDDLATKTWPSGTEGDKIWAAGSDTFSLDDWKKSGK